MDILQSYWDLYNNTVTDMIDKHFKTVCRVVYGNNRLECPNCYMNPIIGNSTNVYKVGGPQPFVDSVCPYCNGEGFVITQQTENINVRAYFNKKDFINMPKLQQCIELIVNTQLQNYAHYSFILLGEIIPWGLGPDKNFCVSHWERN